MFLRSQTPFSRIWPYPQPTLLSRPVADSRDSAMRQLWYHLPSDSSTAWQYCTVQLPHESPSDVAAFWGVRSSDAVCPALLDHRVPCALRALRVVSDSEAYPG